jgi:hypothetical protein
MNWGWGIRNTRTCVLQSELQGGGAKTIYIPKFLETDNSVCEVKIRRGVARRCTCLSFEMPLIKHTTQGKTLIPSFSTRKGTFSTKTRKNLVLKYFGASTSIGWIRPRALVVTVDRRTARCLSMISQRRKLLW